jgi:hypothetical protein
MQECEMQNFWDNEIDFTDSRSGIENLLNTVFGQALQSCNILSNLGGLLAGK